MLSHMTCDQKCALIVIHLSGWQRQKQTKQGRIHGNPVADGWAGAIMREPLAILTIFLSDVPTDTASSRVACPRPRIDRHEMMRTSNKERLKPSIVPLIASLIVLFFVDFFHSTPEIVFRRLLVLSPLLSCDVWNGSYLLHVLYGYQFSPASLLALPSSSLSTPNSNYHQEISINFSPRNIQFPNLLTCKQQQ